MAALAAADGNMGADGWVGGGLRRLVPDLIISTDGHPCPKRLARI